MPDKHALYFSSYCYFCQKVLAKLRDREHQIELRDVSQALYHSELIEGGGKGQVPCLLVQTVDQRRHWMYESDDIISYIKHHGLLT